MAGGTAAAEHRPSRPLKASRKSAVGEKAVTSRVRAKAEKEVTKSVRRPNRSAMRPKKRRNAPPVNLVPCQQCDRYM